MSTLIIGAANGAGGKPLAHITSGAHSNPADLNTQTPIADTIFHSTYANVIQITNEFTYTCTGTEATHSLRMTYVSGSYIDTFITIPNMESFILADNNMYFGWCYNPTLNQSCGLHIGASGCVGDMKYMYPSDPYAIRTTTYNANGMPVQIARTTSAAVDSGTPTGFFLGFDSNSIASMNFFNNKVGMIVKLYKISVATQSGAFTSTSIAPSAQSVSSVQINNKQFLINGVNLASKKILNVEYNVNASYNSRVGMGWYNHNSDGSFPNFSYALTASNSLFPSTVTDVGTFINNNAIGHLLSNGYTSSFAYNGIFGRFKFAGVFSSGGSITITGTGSVIVIMQVSSYAPYGAGSVVYNQSGIFVLPINFTSQPINYMTIAGQFVYIADGSNVITKSGNVISNSSGAGGSPSAYTFLVLEY